MLGVLPFGKEPDLSVTAGRTTSANLHLRAAPFNFLSQKEPIPVTVSDALFCFRSSHRQTLHAQYNLRFCTLQCFTSSNTCCYFARINQIDIEKCSNSHNHFSN